jgi:hypothetical protein
MQPTNEKWHHGVKGSPSSYKPALQLGVPKRCFHWGLPNAPKKFDDGPMKGRCEFYFILEIFDVSTIFLVCSPNGWFPIMLLF